MENKDMVNHPKHYRECSLECIEAMEIMLGPKDTYSGCKCNIFKYLWRHRSKNGEEDLNKALWFVNKAKEYSFSDGDEDLLALEKAVIRHKKEYENN